MAKFMENTYKNVEEKIYEAKSGWGMLLLSILLYLAAVAGTVFGGMGIDRGSVPAIVLFVISLIWLSIGWIFWIGLKVVRPNEALVLTLFGRYVGTLKKEGFFPYRSWQLLLFPMNWK